MEFVQTFKMDDDVCDSILSNLTIEGCEHNSCTPAEIPEIHDPLAQFANEFLKKIEEFNYFGYLHKLSYNIRNVFIRYLPSWRYQMYEACSEDVLNFFIFLKDNDSVFEVFNPFIRGCFRVRPHKGLVVIFPSIWMMIFRHTDTLTKDSVFISGTIDVNNLDDVHQP